MRVATWVLILGIGVLCRLGAGCQSTPAQAPREVPEEATAQAAMRVPDPEDSTILVTERGRVYVFGPDLEEPPLERSLGSDVSVRSVLPAPWGRGILVLLEEWKEPQPDALSQNPTLMIFGLIRQVSRSADWSSRIVWLDPWTGQSRPIFDSHDDRWGTSRRLDAVAEAAGRKSPGLVDNDLTGLFADDEGRLFFTTESGLTVRMDVDAGRLRGLAVMEETPAVVSAGRKETIRGIEGLLVGR